MHERVRFTSHHFVQFALQTCKIMNVRSQVKDSSEFSGINFYSVFDPLSNVVAIAADMPL